MKIIYILIDNKKIWINSGHSRGGVVLKLAEALI